MKKTTSTIIIASAILIAGNASAYVVYSQGQVVYPQPQVVVVQQQPQYTTVAQPQTVVVQQPVCTTVPQTVVVQQPAYVQPQTIVVDQPSTTEVVVGSIAPIIRAITPLVVDHPRYNGWYQPHHPRPMPQRVYRSNPPRPHGGAPMPPPPHCGGNGGNPPPRR